MFNKKSNNVRRGIRLKRLIFGTFFIVIFIVVGVFIYLEFNQKSNSFNTPEDALKNIEDPKYEVVEIIDTKINQAKNDAYVYFYSKIEEPKDYFVISEFEKNKYGWQFKEMNDGVLLSSLSNGSSWFRDDKNGKLYGIATSDVTTVQLGMQVAELIPLKDKNLKIWILFDPNGDRLENDLQFLNKQGKLLN